MATADDAMDVLFWRDELLQIMYWWQGEGLGEKVTAHDLVPFLDAGEALVQQHLERLVSEGLAEREVADPPRYYLTPLGKVEGGRRFADEFAGLTNQAHGECNNPNCVCKTMGPAACAARMAG